MVRKRKSTRFMCADVHIQRSRTQNNRRIKGGKVEENNIETQMLILESLAESVMRALDREKNYIALSRIACIQILKEFYATDRDKYDTVVKIIQERRKNDRRNREQSTGRRNN